MKLTVHLPAWEYTYITVDPTWSHYKIIEAHGQNGWEAWHIERDNGFRTLYFKRPKVAP